MGRKKMLGRKKDNTKTKESRFRIKGKKIHNDKKADSEQKERSHPKGRSLCFGWPLGLIITIEWAVFNGLPIGFKAPYWKAKS